MPDEPQKPFKRLISLDVFRGIAISGMILVNMVGVADKAYPPLLHANWNGCTLADLVFPFFLFIVGVAMPFSFSKYTNPSLDQRKAEGRGQRAEGIYPDAEGTRGFSTERVQGFQSPAELSAAAPIQEGSQSLSKGGRGGLYWRIIRRAIILFALGILLNGFWEYKWSTIRILGVLQRISLTYLLAALIVLNIPKKGQWAIAFLLLIGYWLAMSFVPVPDYGVANWTREGNLGAYCDRLIISKAHLYKGDNYNSMGDPEGLLSTFPATVSVLFGYFTGEWLRRQPLKSRTSITLVIVGLVCLVIGLIWNVGFPINKKLWTSSFVVFTTGWALLLLAACYEWIEVRQKQRWGKPFEIMGLNAIFVFVASVLMIKILLKIHVGTGEKAPTVYAWIYQNLFIPWAGAMNGSFLFALATTLFWLLILYLMYRQRWFIKI